MKPKNMKKKRIIFTGGGKGGTGKTTIVTALLDWLRAKGTPFVAVDFDNENKEHGGLVAFAPDAKVASVDQRDGIDALIALLESDVQTVVADFGARSGEKTFQWFNDVYPALKDMADFTAILIVTPDPATVGSLIKWAKELRDRCGYVVVLNAQDQESPDFSAWESTQAANQFRELAKPGVISLPSFNPDLMRLLRTHHATVRQVAKKEAQEAELNSLRWSVRAQQADRAFSDGFNAVEQFLL